MAEKEYSDEELEELDNYLCKEFNHKIYEELRGDEYGLYENLFEPIEFFRLFYVQVEFIKNNKSKPLLVSRHLKKLDFNDKQLDYLFFKLERYFDKIKAKDNQIKICCREISTLRDNLEIEEEKEEIDETTKNLYRFENVLARLEALPNDREKIACLIQEKTKYEQDSSSWLLSWSKDFGKKCQLEIDKIQSLSRLRGESKPQIVEVGKHKDLTIDRVIFLFNRLIPDFEDCDATKKAEFISFLTGFDYETLRQRFSSIYRKDSDKPQAFKKDMEVICKYLKDLGFDKIVSEIKKDLNFK